MQPKIGKSWDLVGFLVCVCRVLYVVVQSESWRVRPLQLPRRNTGHSQRSHEELSATVVPSQGLASKKPSGHSARHG